jgi:Tfp pilus assembly protein PilO
MITLPLVGGMVLFFMLVFLPTKRRIAELRAELAQKKAFIATTVALPAQIAQVEQKLRECGTHNERWRVTAGGDAAVPELFAAIHQRAQASGAVTTRFDQQEVVPLKTLTEHPVTLGVTGGFGEVFEFLSQLERMPQTLWLEDVQLEASGQDRQTVDCTAKLVIFADNSANSD